MYVEDHYQMSVMSLEPVVTVSAVSARAVGQLSSGESGGLGSWGLGLGGRREDQEVWIAQWRGKVIKQYYWERKVFLTRNL